MKIGIFSDLHIHPWSAFSKLTQKGLNDRLCDLIRGMTRWFRYCESQNCEAIVFSGDLFHVKKIDIETYDLTARALSSLKIPMVMIPGNHDEASNLGHYHSLRVFSHGLLKVLDPREGQTVQQGRLKIGGIPYLGSKERLIQRVQKLARRSLDLLLMHTGFAGATMGFDYIADQKEFIQQQDLPSDVGLVIAGHFHQPQIIGKGHGIEVIPEGGTYNLSQARVLIPGAPVQHTFGDVDSIRGGWIYDDHHHELTFHPWDGPKFVKLTNDDPWTEGAIKDNYVAATLQDPPGKKIRQAKEILSALARGFTLQVIRKELELPSRRMKLGLEMRPKKILQRYVKRMEPQDPGTVLKQGMKLLARVEGGQT